MPLWGFALSFLCATLWAASPIMVNRGLDVSKCTSNEINPIRSVSYLAIMIVVVLVYNRGLPPMMTSVKAFLYLSGNVLFGQIVGDILFFLAIKQIGISLAVPISNAYPMLVALTSWLLLGERITLQVFFGIAVVVAGLIALRLGNREETDESPLEGAIAANKSRLVKGFSLAIAGGVSWAVGAPLTKLAVLESGLGPVDMNFYRAVSMFLLVWCIRFFTVKLVPARTVPLKKVPVAGWLYFMAASTVALAIGSIIYIGCISVMPVAIVTAITSTSPFMAALFGHFVLKQKLYPVQWAGVIMIIAGSIAVSL
jgi:DME family drug/metabolite transporter